MASDQDLHCLSFSLWIWTKRLYDVIWLTDSQKWVWLIKLFSRIRINLCHSLGQLQQTTNWGLGWGVLGVVINDWSIINNTIFFIKTNSGHAHDIWMKRRKRKEYLTSSKYQSISLTVSTTKLKESETVWCFLRIVFLARLYKLSAISYWQACKCAQCTTYFRLSMYIINSASRALPNFFPCCCFSGAVQLVIVPASHCHGTELYSSNYS